MTQSIFTYKTIKLSHETIGKYSFPNHQIHITNAFDGHYNDINLSDQNLHTHDFYMLTWVECGNFEYTFGIEKYHIDSSTLLLIAPGDIHSYYSDCVIEGFSIFFTENFFCSLPENCSHYLKHNILWNLPFLKYKSEESRLAFKTSVETLKYNLRLFSNHRRNYIGVYAALTLLLYGISETEEFKSIASKIEKAQKQSLELYFAFLDKLEVQYKKFHSVQHYADELRISVNKLNMYCKECSGETPLTIINNRIMLEAKRLLIYTLSRSGEISNLLGFVEHAHFVNYFKKHINMTPTEFRSKYGKRP